MWRLTNQGSGTNRRETSYEYDLAGQVWKIFSEIASSTPQRRVKFEYDAYANLRKLYRLKNGVEKPPVEYEYDKAFRPTAIIDPLSRETTIAYDPYCKKFVETTERGIVRHYWRDVLCRLTEVDPVNGNIHSYEYDELSRLVRVVQYPPGATSQVYDTYGRAVFGTSRYSDDQTPIVTLSERDFEYDELDRLKKVTFDGSATIEYGYDAEGNLISLTDVHGNVTEYTYYNDDRLREVLIKRPPAADRVFTYSYDAAGRLSEIVYPSSTGIKAVFDDGATPTPNPGWNENGQLTHLRYLKKDGMGVYQHFHSFEYEYDPSGNRKKFIDTPENTANKITWEYSYDWLNRLTEVKRGDGAATPTTQRVYAYDESDNRTFLDDHVNNLSLHYTYDNADQILEIREGSLSSRDTVNDFSTVVESFTHNADGMMTSRTVDPNGTPVTTTYTFDEFDNLVEIDGPLGVVVNSYDPGDIRDHKVGVDSVEVAYRYAGLLLLNEMRDPSGTPIETSYFQAHVVLGFDEAGDFFYFLPDGLGSVRVLLNETGGEAASYVHDEFGTRIAASELGGTSSQTFVGGLGVRDDSQIGLLYMRARFYDPALGRFFSPDPLGEKVGNRYVYAANSPAVFVDPDGLFPGGATAPKLPPGPSVPRGRNFNVIEGGKGKVSTAGSKTSAVSKFGWIGTFLHLLTRPAGDPSDFVERGASYADTCPSPDRHPNLNQSQRDFVDFLDEMCRNHFRRLEAIVDAASWLQRTSQYAKLMARLRQELRDCLTDANNMNQYNWENQTWNVLPQDIDLKKGLLNPQEDCGCA